MENHFYEEQKFIQWWLWLLIITTFATPFIIGIFAYYNDQEAFEAISTPAIIGTSIFTIVIITFFLILKLTTKIDSKKISITFFPFVNKTIDWREVKSAQVLNYGFVGGWGIRLFTKYGTVYNVRGNKGLALFLENGKKFVIGTQKETELRAFIEKIGK